MAIPHKFPCHCEEQSDMAISWYDPPKCTAPRPPLLRGGCQPNRLTGGVRYNVIFLPPALRATPLVNAGGKRTDSHGPYGASE